MKSKEYINQLAAIVRCKAHTTGHITYDSNKTNLFTDVQIFRFPVVQIMMVQLNKLCVGRRIRLTVSSEGISPVSRSWWVSVFVFSVLPRLAGYCALFGPSWFFYPVFSGVRTLNLCSRVCMDKSMELWPAAWLGPWCIFQPTSIDCGHNVFCSSLKQFSNIDFKMIFAVHNE